MSRSEADALQDVAARLKGRFPDAPAGAVQEIIADEYAKLTGPVRAYIPILVERAARRRLQELGSTPYPVAS